MIAIPLARENYMKEFGTPKLQNIAKEMKILREEYDGFEKRDEVIGEYDEFFNQLYSICEDSPVEPEFQYDAVYAAGFEASALLLHINEELYADAFAIIQQVGTDTFIKLICSSAPGMGAMLLQEIGRIAKQEGHTSITGDAISAELVKYYSKRGFNTVSPIPEKYKGIVKHNFIIKPVGGGRRRKTKRRKSRRSLRIINH